MSARRPRRSGADARRRSRRTREGELGVVEWLASRTETAGLVGDDAAIFGSRSAHVVTVDTQIAGVHFPPDLAPAVLARRLIAITLSDLAAMGARPAHAFLALAAPAGFAHQRFFDAFLRETARHRLILAGGDLASAPQIYASLTLIGERWPGARRWLRRDAARPGDAILLGGTVGESSLGLELVRRGARIQRAAVSLPPALGLPVDLAAAARRAVRRHLLPSAQLELGRWLATLRYGAAMDVSDGVALDLHRLCAASGVGASVEARLLPRSAGFERLASALGLDPLGQQLGGGEDYVLLFTLTDRAARAAVARGARVVGRVERGRQLTLVEAGRRTPLAEVGWDHLRAPP